LSSRPIYLKIPGQTGMRIFLSTNVYWRWQQVNKIWTVKNQRLGNNRWGRADVQRIDWPKYKVSDFDSGTTPEWI
jgi:SPX domain protein involved in polyphosphate accumulation